MTHIRSHGPFSLLFIVVSALAGVVAAAIGLLLVIGTMLLAGVVAAALMLRAWFRGRRGAAFDVRWTRGPRRGASMSQARRPAATGDVVDIEAREVTTRPQPADATSRPRAE